MTTTDRICTFLESKLPASFWRFHGDSIRSFVEKEVSLNPPISPRSETTEFSDESAEDVWHDGSNPPNDTRYVMGEWAGGVVGECLYGIVSGKWYECPAPHYDLPPIRWRELTDAERESIYD